MNFFSYLIRRPLPTRATLRTVLTPPLRWYGIVLWTLIGAVLVVTYSTLVTLNNHFLISVPARGGTLTEGVIGAPRLINPTLATTDTDKSLVKLLYSGLIRTTTDGAIVPDLATSYSASSDGLVYTVTLPEKLKWSDNKKLTSADVAFTMTRIVTMTGVGVTTPNEHVVVFTLPAPDPQFLSKLTIGIIPKHIWEGIEAETPEFNQYNLSVIGSGPFKVSQIQTESGIPVEIILRRNRHYSGTKPFLDTYQIKFFNNQSELVTAFNTGSIDLSMGVSSDTTKKITARDILSNTIPSTRSLSIVALPGDTTTIGAHIDTLIDKGLILAIVDSGYGILPSVTSREHSLISAPIALAIENTPRTLNAANLIAQELQELGVTVSIKAFDQGSFQEGIDGKMFALALIDMTTIPNGYNEVSKLYTIGYPFLYNKDSFPVLPPLITDSADRYTDIALWHARTHKVWKLFTQ